MVGSQNAFASMVAVIDRSLIVDRTRPLPHPVAGGPLVASLLIDTPTGPLGSGRRCALLS
jgi:hypothetical protein